jgi:CRP/FNR family transcriptional regulator, cyclic AMP receptor protein
MARHALHAAIEPPKARIQRALKLCQLFDRVSRATREAALAAAELTPFGAGDVLAEQGSPATHLLLLGRGRARAERTLGASSPEKQRVVPLGYRGLGEILFEGCLGGATENDGSAVSMEAGELVTVPTAVVRDLIARDAALGNAALALLVARQRETEDRIESLLFRDVEGRLCDFLLRAAERWGVPSPRGVLIAAPVTHLEIAQSIGSTRETVTLTLGALKRSGLLDVAGRRLIVKDKDALAARA